MQSRGSEVACSFTESWQQQWIEIYKYLDSALDGERESKQIDVSTLSLTQDSASFLPVKLDGHHRRYLYEILQSHGKREKYGLFRFPRRYVNTG
jgi:hypothetical protein